MKVQNEKLKSRYQTAEKIKRLIIEYADDLKLWAVPVGNSVVPLSDLSMEKFFDLVRKMPYKRDSHNIEVVARPKHILSGREADCKKKAILMCAWALNNGIKYRLIGSSNKINGNIHHIFPQFYINGKWYNVDATYSYYKLFQPKEVTKYEIF